MSTRTLYFAWALFPITVDPLTKTLTYSASCSEAYVCKKQKQLLAYPQLTYIVPSDLIAWYFPTFQNKSRSNLACVTQTFCKSLRFLLRTDRVYDFSEYLRRNKISLNEYTTVRNTAYKALKRCDYVSESALRKSLFCKESISFSTQESFDLARRAYALYVAEYWALSRIVATTSDAQGFLLSSSDQYEEKRYRYAESFLQDVSLPRITVPQIT